MSFAPSRDCGWAERLGTEEQLKQHLEEEHKTELETITRHMLRGAAPDAMYSAYNQAIAQRCRSQAPIAGASLDRTALYSFADATKGDKVEALICWCCGCIHPRVEDVEDKGPIKWYQPLATQRLHRRAPVPEPAIAEREGAYWLGALPQQVTTQWSPINRSSSRITRILRTGA